MAAGMDQSRWSELPEDLVHHIFSFLPTISEAARLCLLSKSWQHAWHSYLEGPSFVFIYTEDSPSKLQKFYKFVEDTMSNFTTQRSIRKIHNFVLKSATLFDYVRDSIDIAIDNQVSEMTLSTNYYLRQQIPAKILNNSCLKSLNLDLPVYWGERRNDPTVSVNLPTLQSLTLSNIGVRTLERFLEGCPLLKTLRCSRFRCSSAGKSFLTDHSCSKLEFLSLEITHFNAESFDEFLPKLGFLETLILSFKENDDRISISNASVSNFELHIWESIGEVVIDTPRLSCFRYTKHNCGWMLKPRISMMQPTKNCQAHLTIPFYYINFQKDLTELVGLCGDLRTLSIFHRLKVCYLTNWSSTSVNGYFLQHWFEVDFSSVHLFFRSLETKPMKVSLLLHHR